MTHTRIQPAQAIANELTIIVSSYNCAKFLPNTLNSIFAQTWIPKHVIVIDDASPDNSNQIVREYQKRYSNITLICNDGNKGVNPTVNRGFNTADTKYVMSLAADDWILPTFVEESLTLLNRYPDAGMCSTGSFIAIEDSNQITQPASMPIPLKTAGYLSPTQAWKKLFKLDSWYMGNSVIMNREMLLQLGGYNNELYSFADNFLYRQLSLKHGCCFIPTPLSVWRIRGHGYSQTDCRSLERMVNIMSLYKDSMYHYNSLFTSPMIEREMKRWSFKINKLLINMDNKSLARRLSNKALTYFLFAYIRPFDLLPFIVRKATPGMR